MLGIDKLTGSFNIGRKKLLATFIKTTKTFTALILTIVTMAESHRLITFFRVAQKEPVNYFFFNRLRNDVYRVDWRGNFQSKTGLGIVYKAKSFQKFVKVYVAIFVHIYTFSQVFNRVQRDVRVCVFV